MWFVERFCSPPGGTISSSSTGMRPSVLWCWGRQPPSLWPAAIPHLPLADWWCGSRPLRDNPTWISFFLLSQIRWKTWLLVLVKKHAETRDSHPSLGIVSSSVRVKNGGRFKIKEMTEIQIVKFKQKKKPQYLSTSRKMREVHNNVVKKMSS